MSSTGSPGLSRTHTAGPDAETSHQQIAAEEQTAKRAIAEGIGLFFSTGDYGDYKTQVGYVTTQYPASSPHVTAMGGNTLAIGPARNYRFETAWGLHATQLSGGAWTPAPPGPFKDGGSGGTTRLFAEPGYQKGVVPGRLAKRWGGRGRVLPDISMDGDPSTGFLVGQTQTFPEGSTRYNQYAIGGTSLASPLFAGYMALADAAAGFHHGFVNPALYRLYGRRPLRDVRDVRTHLAQVLNVYANGVNRQGGVHTLPPHRRHGLLAQGDEGLRQRDRAGKPPWESTPSRAEAALAATLASRRGADTLAAVRVLVVTNITPDEAAPWRGQFVRDQVDALRRAGVDVELHSFRSGTRNYPRATAAIRRILRRERFDLVHAHFGLAGWCAALAGARPLVVTFHGTDVRHPVTGFLSRRLVGRLDLIAAASLALFGPENGRPALPRRPGANAVLPCGADLERFRPASRTESREALGLDPGGRYLLFPAATSRPVKRYDRAQEVAALLDAELLSGDVVGSAQMPTWMNAANAVVVTSDNEGFGMVAVESLACDVPVFSTPVGVAPFLLRGVDGCLAAPFDARDWAEAIRPHLETADPRVAGRGRAAWFSAQFMAERVIEAYRELLERGHDLS